MRLMMTMKMAMRRGIKFGQARCCISMFWMLLFVQQHTIALGVRLGGVFVVRTHTHTHTHRHISYAFIDAEKSSRALWLNR